MAMSSVMLMASARSNERLVKLADVPYIRSARFALGKIRYETQDSSNTRSHPNYYSSIPLYSYGTPEVSKYQKMVVFENKDVGDGACFMMIL